MCAHRIVQNSWEMRGVLLTRLKIWESAALGFEPGTLLLRDFGVASAANPKLG